MLKFHLLDVVLKRSGLWTDTPSVKSARIRPGVRWQRMGRFPDDPDVSELYETLRRVGKVSLKLPPRRFSLGLLPAEIKANRARRARQISEELWLFEVLVRRAGEDGFRLHTDNPFVPSWAALEGPLDQRSIDPMPAIRTDAAKLYKKMRDADDHTTGMPIDYGRNPFLDVSLMQATLDELERLAAEHGCTVKLVANDDIDVYATLVRT